MGIYEELGIRRVINAIGNMTHLGGSIPDYRVMDAMKEASQSFVIMMELIEKAGSVIAEATGAEAGLVTAGSSASLVLGTAACLMRGSDLEMLDIHPFERLSVDGESRELIQKLPDASWTKNEVLIQSSHRSPYDHAFKVAGGRLILVGTYESCTPEELEAAISDKTAAIAFFACVDDVGVSLEDTIKIAKIHDVPVIVDAASELPPRSNLKRYISDGADLVAFSGGKKIAGPNDTGILCGRRDLIKLAKMQAPPYRGIGRAAKIDRTQIIGLITALRLWLEKDEEEEFNEWNAKARVIAENLKVVPNISKSDVVVGLQRSWVKTHITIDDENGLSASEVVFNLRKGNPSIWVKLIGYNKIGIETSLLKDGEDQLIVSALKRILDKKIG